MNADLKVKKGKLFLNEISFTRVLKRNVMKNDTTGSQGKIALPKELIDKSVLVIVPEDYP